MYYFSLIITTLCLFSTVYVIVNSGSGDQWIPICLADNGTSEENNSNNTSECLTLSEFAANINQYINFSTAILDPGVHVLTESLIVSDMSTFKLTSNNSYTAEIVCENNSSFNLSYSQNIYIANVHFLGCGGNLVEEVDNFVLKNAIFYGNNSNGTALQLRESTANITDCLFSFYTRGTLTVIHLGTIIIPEVPPASGGIHAGVGGALMVTNTSVTIKSVHFMYNRADLGGAVFLRSSNATIENSTFVNNQHNSSEGFNFECNTSTPIPICMDTQITAGGALFQMDSQVSISNSMFSENSAAAGGAVFAIYGEINFSSESVVCDNTASNYDGGAIHAWHARIEIVDSQFGGNIVQKLDGGAVFCFLCSVVIQNSNFSSNIAISEGGGLFLLNSNITIDESIFTKNIANFRGGVLYTYLSRVELTDNQMTGNRANTGAAMIIIASNTYSGGFLTLSDHSEANISTSLHLIDSTFLVRGNFTFFNNHGSMMVFNTNVTFEGIIVFKNNYQQNDSNARTELRHPGGAITLFQSTITFLSEACIFEDNTAENGGAIHSSQSKLFMKGTVDFVNNRASENGGSMYLDQSELICENRSLLTIMNSTATQRGGSIHAISTSIKVNAFSNITLCSNSAESGGALSLETNSKVYVLRYSMHDSKSTLHFIGNSASYGGAVFVNDDTYAADACTGSDTECFFQVFALYHEVFLNRALTSDLGKSFDFQDNQAYVHGSSLFGGFLNRCTMSSFVGMDYGYNGSVYFNEVSTGESTSHFISSRPTQVCPCIADAVCCKCLNPSIEVKKGEMFTVSLVAVDQMGELVKATIQSGLMFNESGLAEGQLRRTIPDECIELTFNVISPQDSEELALYASDGPCKDAAASVLTLQIQFLPCSCPIGFQPSGISMVNCTCECHSDVAPFVSNCDIESESVLRHPQSKAWISSILHENTSDYLIYPNCPYDYCKSNEHVAINLNHLNGSNSQCAFNRSLLLCGSCKVGLSLSLGSTHCLTCPSYWPALFIIITITAAIAGIALVALLLILNLTVAVGTLNGLIFYANVISANKSILLPFSSPNFMTVIISWLNLDIGIDTCYFNGMDAYAKSWLQLAFPAYMLLLVAAVIIICSISSKFSNFIGKRDPVATLATIILMSYATILENIFRALTPGRLVYPNGKVEIIWLPDAMIKYFSGLHIPLFIAAVFILIIGLTYTVLLFSWQWLLCLPRWKIFRWIRNQRLHTFIETYSIPYTPQHRYWTGLLLLARAILYLIVATNVSNDPQLRLTSIIFIVGGIIFLKSLAGYRLYKDSFIDKIENVFYFNILALATLTWYAVNGENIVHNSAIAYVSITVTLILLILLILYHLNTYTTLLSIFHKTTAYRKLLKMALKPGPGKSQQPTVSTAPLNVNNDDDMDRFNELMDVLEGSINTNDYQNDTTARSDKPTEPTCSTVVAIGDSVSDDNDTDRFNELMDVIEASENTNDCQSKQNGTAHSERPTESICSIAVTINESENINDEDVTRINDLMEGSQSPQNGTVHSEKVTEPASSTVVAISAESFA